MSCLLNPTVPKKLNVDEVLTREDAEQHPIRCALSLM